MKFIQQLDRNDKINNAKTVTFENVMFKNFAKFMQDLVVDKLLNEEWTRKGNSWGDYRHRGGILLETDTNPMIYEQSNLTVSGSRSAIQRFNNIFERHTSYDSTYEDDIDLYHQYHSELNDELWVHDDDGYELDERVRDHLLNSADEFITFLKMPNLEIDDIVFTGSAANYNWTKDSDIDLHVIVDKKKAEKLYGSIIEEYFDAKKRVWNDLHNITIHGFPVEFYVEGAGETHHSSGIYSILNQEWVVEPKHAPPSIDDNAVKTKAAELIREIKDVIKSNKAGPVERILDKITKMRQAGLDKGGEFETRNLVFKQLRRDGWLEKLHNLKAKTFDRALSVEDEEWSNLLK